MRRLFIVTAVAVSAGFVVPAVASATKKFESTVAWTHTVDTPAKLDPFLFATVTSESPKCIKGRRVVITDELDERLTKTTDADGIFGLSREDTISELPGSEYDTKLQRKKFGKKGKKKICLPDSATFTFIKEPVSTSINDLSFDAGTNTFTGTLVSENPKCVQQRDVGIYDLTGLQNIGVTESEGTGAFTYTHGEAPSPGTYDAYADTINYVTFKPNGDGTHHIVTGRRTPTT